MGFVLETVGLVKEYGQLKAVDNLNLKVSAGEFFGLLGPNGAGKTTTISMIYGLTKITKGEIRVNGLNISNNLRRIKESIGITQQEDNLDGDLNVFDNLFVWGRYYGIPKSECRRRTKEALTFVDLLDKKTSRINELSGGMRRRLVMARALMNKPTILLLDEPTTGLDPPGKHLIWDRLRQLNEEGVTILLTTQNMEEAEELCERVVIINDGHSIMEGNPKEIIREVIGEKVLDVVVTRGERAKFERILKKENAKWTHIENRFVILQPDGLFETVAPFCKKVTCRPPKLEDLFLVVNHEI